MTKVSSGIFERKTMDVLHRVHNRMRAKLASRTLSMQERPFLKAEANAIAWAIEKINGERPFYESVDHREKNQVPPAAQ